MLSSISNKRNNTKNIKCKQNYYQIIDNKIKFLIITQYLIIDIKKQYRREHVKAAIWALCNLCRFHHQDINVVQQICLTLCSILKSGIFKFEQNDRFMADILWGLGFISSGSKQRINFIIQQKITKYLISCLLSTLHYVVAAVLKILDNFDYQCQQQIHQIIDNGFFHIAPILLTHPYKIVSKTFYCIFDKIVSRSNTKITQLIQNKKQILQICKHKLDSRQQNIQNTEIKVKITTIFKNLQEQNKILTQKLYNLYKQSRIIENIVQNLDNVELNQANICQLLDNLYCILNMEFKLLSHLIDSSSYCQYRNIIDDNLFNQFEISNGIMKLQELIENGENVEQKCQPILQLQKQFKLKASQYQILQLNKNKSKNYNNFPNNYHINFNNNHNHSSGYDFMIIVCKNEIFIQSFI